MAKKRLRTGEVVELPPAEVAARQAAHEAMVAAAQEEAERQQLVDDILFATLTGDPVDPADRARLKQLGRGRGNLLP